LWRPGRARAEVSGRTASPRPDGSNGRFRDPPPAETRCQTPRLISAAIRGRGHWLPEQGCALDSSEECSRNAMSGPRGALVIRRCTAPSRPHGGVHTKVRRAGRPPRDVRLPRLGHLRRPQSALPASCSRSRARGATNRANHQRSSGVSFQPLANATLIDAVECGRRPALQAMLSSAGNAGWSFPVRNPAGTTSLRPVGIPSLR